MAAQGMKESKQQPLIEHRYNSPDCPEVKTAKAYRGEAHFLLCQSPFPSDHNPELLKTGIIYAFGWWELFVNGDTIKIE